MENGAKALSNKYVSNNVRRDFSLPVSAFATIALKRSNGKITAKKNHFPVGHFVTITDADIESLKSLRTLFDKYLDHILMKFEQNRMVRNIQKFLERIDAIFKTLL